MIWDVKSVCCSVLQCVEMCFTLWGLGGRRISQKQRYYDLRRQISVLQCVAVCYSVLQCVAVCCSVLLCVFVGSWRMLNLSKITSIMIWDVKSVCCSVLQCIAVCCSVLQCVVVCFTLWGLEGREISQKQRYYDLRRQISVLQCVAVCCSVLQCVAVCCSVLQCVLLCEVLEDVEFLKSQRYYDLRRQISVLQCVAVYCSVLQCVVVCFTLWVLEGRRISQKSALLWFET